MPRKMLPYSAVSVLALTHIAASAATSTESTLEEIIVTATKRAQNIQDIPYNVSAVSGEQLRVADVTRTEDLLKVIPGISVIDGGARNRNAVSIRGIGVPGASASDYFSTDATSYYLDEAPLESMNFRIKDVERVEVLRGPQGTLYGGGSLGGTVRYILNKADLKGFSGNVATQLSETDGAGRLGSDTDFAFNIPLIDQRLALRLSGDYYYQPGFITYQTFPDQRASGALPPRLSRHYNDEHTGQGRMSLTWKINDRWQTHFAYAHQKMAADGRQAYTLNSTDVLGNINNDFVNHRTYAGFNDETAERALDLYSATLQGELGFADLIIAPSYYKDSYTTQADITRFLGTLAKGFYLGYAGLNGYNHNAIESKTRSLEVRLQSSGVRPIDWIAGGFATSQTRSWKDLESTPGLNSYVYGPGTTVVANDFNLESTGKYRQTAFFGEATWHATPALDLTGGLRYFRMSDEIGMKIWYPIYEGLQSYNTPDKQAFDQTNRVAPNKTFFKFNASYRITSKMLSYATYSQGFRRGGANAVSAQQAGSNDPALLALLKNARFYQPDTLNNFEVGLKSTLLDGRMTLNGDVYYMNWRNLQGYTGTVLNAAGQVINLPIDQRVNIGDAVSKGVELELRAQVTRNAEISGGLSYNDIRAQGDSPYLAKGDRIAGKPHWQGNSAVTYHKPIAAESELRLSGGVSFRDRELTNNPSHPYLPGYALLDASVSWVHSSWEVKLFIDNLTNHESETAFSSSEGERKIYVNRPRTSGLSIHYKI